MRFFDQCFYAFIIKYSPTCLQLNHMTFSIFKFILYHFIFCTNLKQVIAYPDQNVSQIENTLTPIANIPNTINVLDELKSKLKDVLRDFHAGLNYNQSNRIDPLEESNVPLTLNDVISIEHNGDNPLDPELIDPEEDTPDAIVLAKGESKSANADNKFEEVPKLQKLVSRATEEIVCGMSW